jgi:hypothetical protein
MFVVGGGDSSPIIIFFVYLSNEKNKNCEKTRDAQAAERLRFVTVSTHRHVYQLEVQLKITLQSQQEKVPEELQPRSRKPSCLLTAV